jgi:2-iminobutanoate/2-iminopropanoate deaminase
MKSISTPHAPAAIGPYSQAVVAGNMVFCSGQIALDPKTMQLVGDTAAMQTEQALVNLTAVLDAAGTGLDHVVKTTVFLKNMDDFASMNEVYSRFFGSHRPARAAVEAARLPKGALVEIECIAIL